MAGAKPDTWMPGKWVEFDPTCFPAFPVSDVPNLPAVYVIMLDSVAVYVGQSHYLRERINRHGIRRGYAKNYHTPWASFPDTCKLTAKAKLSVRYGDWAMWELRLIRRLKPRFNGTFVSKRSAKVAA